MAETFTIFPILSGANLNQLSNDRQQINKGAYVCPQN